MNLKIMAVLTIGLCLQACSGSSSNNGANDGTLDPTTQAQAQSAADQCKNTPVQDGTDIRYVLSSESNGRGCTTGCQIFNSMASYCSALQDDQLNHYCARDQRNEQYQSTCVNQSNTLGSSSF